MSFEMDNPNFKAPNWGSLELNFKPYKKVVKLNHQSEYNTLLQ